MLTPTLFVLFLIIIYFDTLIYYFLTLIRVILRALIQLFPPDFTPQPQCTSLDYVLVLNVSAFGTI